MLFTDSPQKIKTSFSVTTWRLVWRKTTKLTNLLTNKCEGNVNQNLRTPGETDAELVYKCLFEILLSRKRLSEEHFHNCSWRHCHSCFRKQTYHLEYFCQCSDNINEIVSRGCTGESESNNKPSQSVKHMRGRCVWKILVDSISINGSPSHLRCQSCVWWSVKSLRPFPVYSCPC